MSQQQNFNQQQQQAGMLTQQHLNILMNGGQVTAGNVVLSLQPGQQLAPQPQVGQAMGVIPQARQH